MNLTIEPVTFGNGLRIFSDQADSDPLKIFTNRGFSVATEQELNTAGTRYLELYPE
ncbi:MAG: hypothetical protein GKR98_03190 [Boseongicola sp.]|nr:MAG: hypothetical protein GKR98_03190 [Boseongicola sp.]